MYKLYKLRESGESFSDVRGGRNMRMKDMKTLQKTLKLIYYNPKHYAGLEVLII